MCTVGQVCLQVHIHMAKTLKEIMLVHREAEAITDFGGTDDVAHAG